MYSLKYDLLKIVSGIFRGGAKVVRKFWAFKK
jgi:hypothetical protein